MNRSATGLRCLCGGEQFDHAFSYTMPPQGETTFAFTAGRYHREVWRCRHCGHFRSVHEMEADGLYRGEYVSSTYGDEGMRRAFERVIALDPSASDNAGRVSRILAFAAERGLVASADCSPSVLDVGSGLCVFLHRMKAAGWRCTALDPDERAVAHAREQVGVEAVCGDFMTAPSLGRFDAVTFNKVLEHVKDPVATLARAAEHVTPNGVVYVEVPDGEAAQAHGFGREEFFIEHRHIFTAASLAILVARAGLRLVGLERLCEPSGKYTLRAFALAPQGSPRTG